MVNLSYDLHIHSCLSPCGDEDMTPANIAGMAAVKGLDVIAITDHNSCKNCKAVIEAGKAYGIIVIPGMELCTIEEVHVLCLFPTLSNALDFDAYVDSKSNYFPNDEAIFGRQIRYNEHDEIIGFEPNLLINGVNISFDQVWEVVRRFKGIMIPAHIDKNSNSLLSNLGFVPPDSKFRCVEFKDMTKLHSLTEKNPYLKECTIISNSDAHYLEHINEPYLTIQAASKTPDDILQALNR